MSWGNAILKAPSIASDAIAAVSAGGMQMTAVHPWLGNIGTGSGHYKYLSFPNAVEHALGMIDTAQPVFGLAVAASNLGDFISAAGALSSVFPMKQLQQLQRRASMLAAIETDKWLLPEVQFPQGMVGTGLSLKSLPTIRDIAQAAEAEVMQALADEWGGTDPLANIGEWKDIALAHAAQVSAAVGNITGAISPGVIADGLAFKFHELENIGSALKNNMPGHDRTLSALMLFQGDDLSMFTEFFE